MASKKSSPKVAVVSTVFNEETTVSSLVSALKSQTLAPFEVVVVDGGSSDGTYIRLKQEANKWPTLKIYQVPGNRSVGRNLAVSHTTAPLIAFTDAGCQPQPSWLEELVKPFESSGIQVVSGYYQGLPHSVFEKCLVPYVLVMPDKAAKTEFFPSTRSMAMRRDIWNQSGGFDIRLNHNEDYAFAHWLKRMGVNFVFAPKAIVSWIPRKNLRQAAWMFTRFAIGDVQAGIIRPKVKMLFLRYLIFIYLFSLAFQSPTLFFPLSLVAVLYVLWSINKNFRYVRHPLAFFWFPVLQITADMSVMFGTLVGLLAKLYGLF